jgi:hypothetical protein
VCPLLFKELLGRPSLLVDASPVHVLAMTLGPPAFALATASGTAPFEFMAKTFVRGRYLIIQRYICPLPKDSQEHTAFEKAAAKHIPLKYTSSIQFCTYLKMVNKISQ